MWHKGFILQSSYGSVFSAVENLEEKVGEQNNEKLVTIAGRVNNPGTIEIPENSTLRDVIGLVGGIKNKKNFGLFSIWTSFWRTFNVEKFR